MSPAEPLETAPPEETRTCDWPDENGQLCGEPVEPKCHGFCFRHWWEIGP